VNGINESFPGSCSWLDPRNFIFLPIWSLPAAFLESFCRVVDMEKPKFTRETTKANFSTFSTFKQDIEHFLRLVADVDIKMKPTALIFRLFWKNLLCVDFWKK
jgi:hypothetical protein